jgi:type IV pilus assembly protein PilV
MVPLKEQGMVRGFSLVELTVATAIFSLGIGGLSLLFLLALQGTLESKFRVAAVSQAASLQEMMWLAPEGRAAFMAPGESPAEPACDGGALCTPELMAGSMLESWQRQLESGIPSGRGLVCRDSTPSDGTPSEPACDGIGTPVIKVFWEEPGNDGAVAHRSVRALPLP